MSSDVDEKIVAMRQRDPPATYTQIQRKLDVSRPKIARTLKKAGMTRSSSSPPAPASASAEPTEASTSSPTNPAATSTSTSPPSNPPPSSESKGTPEQRLKKFQPTAPKPIKRPRTPQMAPDGSEDDEGAQEAPGGDQGASGGQGGSHGRLVTLGVCSDCGGTIVGQKGEKVTECPGCGESFE